MSTPQYTITSPHSLDLQRARDEFLQATLRDASTSWSIANEYPTVLSNHETERSYCLMMEQTMASHANMWIRDFKNQSSSQTIRVAFVGNVATREAYRGQGLQRDLFDHLSMVAARQGCVALLLWSDLFDFYAKLGFHPTGRELRFFLRHTSLPAGTSANDVLSRLLTKPADVSDEDLRTMLALRPRSTWAVVRSIDEFRSLLSIPNTKLYVLREHKRIKSYFIVGKGSDMNGVIHEWGSHSPKELGLGLKLLCSSPEIAMLLAPSNIQSIWHQTIQRCTESSELHPMMLSKSLLEDKTKAAQIKAALSDSFIWGLDSI